MPALPATVKQLWRWREQDRAKKVIARDESGDPDLDGAESEGLERFRMAKAQLAELELEKRRGEVIDVRSIRAMHVRMAALLRGAGEQLERTVSRDAAEILESALNECDRELATVFKDDEHDDSDGD